MTQKQARQIALEYLGTIALQDDILGGLVEGEADQGRLEAALSQLGNELCAKSGLVQEYQDAESIIEAVLKGEST